jgi:hypothetical protein
VFASAHRVTGPGIKRSLVQNPKEIPCVTVKFITEVYDDKSDPSKFVDAKQLVRCSYEVTAAEKIEDEVKT